MICSLNQIEQTARKAVRGAGLPWGLADDAGKAVRWLHIYGLQGVSALVEVLGRHDYSNAATIARLVPASLGGVWRATGGVLDPLLAGASLNDRFDRPGDAVVETAAIARPVLVAGFIGNAAEIEDRTFTLTWPAVSLCCRRGGLWVEGEQQAVDIETAEFLCCQQSAPSDDVADAAARALPGRHYAPRIAEATVESDAWARLEQYAHRTYVETTAASRLAGAGAGLHDND